VKKEKEVTYFFFKWWVDIRHNFLFEARNIWRPGPVEHLALSQGRAWWLMYENCFFDIEKFTMTQVNYLIAPATVNSRLIIRRQLTTAGTSGS